MFMHIGTVVNLIVLEIYESSCMCGREPEWKMLLSHLSAPLLVEIMVKGGFFSHFSVHLQFRIRGRHCVLSWRGTKRRALIRVSLFDCRRTKCSKHSF
jgi:hypothetical protein